MGDRQQVLGSTANRGIAALAPTFFLSVRILFPLRPSPVDHWQFVELGKSFKKKKQKLGGTPFPPPFLLSSSFWTSSLAVS